MADPGLMAQPPPGPFQCRFVQRHWPEETGSDLRDQGIGPRRLHSGRDGGDILKAVIFSNVAQCAHDTRPSSRPSKMRPVSMGRLRSPMAGLRWLFVPLPPCARHQAAPDHLGVRYTPMASGWLTATGFQLPPSTFPTCESSIPRPEAPFRLNYQARRRSPPAGWRASCRPRYI